MMNTNEIENETTFCLKCLNTFDEKYLRDDNGIYYCPIEDCQTRLVHEESNTIAAIRKLGDKGYSTSFRGVEYTSVVWGTPQQRIVEIN